MAVDKRTEMIIQEIVRRINRTDDRLRILEQRIKVMDSSLSSLEASSIKQTNELKDKSLAIEAKIKIMSEKLDKIENLVEKLNENLKNYAKRSDIKEIEEMFSLLNPIKNEFVTRKELLEILREEKT
ncbi:MAG: hypothetical protein QXJ96_00250 [Candidatus Aenigmatarchaeota archaeon]|nr:hypothetical protein [Candidatus Aenigmarchaeota archaeon]